MKTCTFFGHRDTPYAVRPVLLAVVEELVEREGVTQFYMGSQGRFDEMARSVVREVKARHPQIRCGVVVERLPQKPEEHRPDSIFPEGLELAPPRFAIARRNEWMVDQADVVVAYVTHDWGGAARYTERAERRGKRVIRLSLGDFSWMSAELMKRMLRNDAVGSAVLPVELAMKIMTRLAALESPGRKTAGEAWENFQRWYMPGRQE